MDNDAAAASPASPAAAAASAGNHIRLVGMFAGVGSGLSKVAVGHGFDTIKTRLQCAPTGTYRGAIDCLMQTVRNESVFALYKGATPPAIGWAAIDSVLLGSLHNYRLFFLRNGFTEAARGAESGAKGVRLTLVAHGLAGLCAGLTSALLATPMELLKVKLQLQLQRATADRQFKGPIDCARQIVRAQGVSGLWTGFTGSLVFRSNFFWMFLSIEALMRGFGRLGGTPYEQRHGQFLSGGLASFAFWAFAMPADNVKSRQMAAPLSGERASFLAVARQIRATDGLGGFYKGMVPILLRAFPTNACAYFVYEGLMGLLAAEQTRQ